MFKPSHREIEDDCSILELVFLSNTPSGIGVVWLVARGMVVPSTTIVVRTILVSIACKPTAVAGLYYIAWHASQLVAAAVEKLLLLLLSAANAQPFKTLEA